MKKTILLIVLAALCLNFSVKAQEKLSITALKIGDQVPNITINNIINYKSADGNPITSAKISDFKGKLLILDFWATWCAPCVAMIPKMDSLQRRFSGQIQFLPIAYQPKREVSPFLAKIEIQQNIHFNLPEIFEDNTLSHLFPHKTLPHFVWINSDGVVQAITEFTEVNSNNIITLLNRQSLSLKPKVDINVHYDVHKPLFGSEESDTVLKSKSVLTGYIDGLGSGFYHNFRNSDPKVPRRITARNLSIPQLYQIVFGKGTSKIGWNRTLLLVDNPSDFNSEATGQKYRDWLRNNHGFCYELIETDREINPFNEMEFDLEKSFRYVQANLEKRKVKCLILKTQTKSDSLITKGGDSEFKVDQTGCNLSNQKLNVLTNYMDYYVMQDTSIPVIDETGITQNVDLHINGDLKNVQKINSEINKYGLKFEFEERPVEFLVIRNKAKS